MTDGSATRRTIAVALAAVCLLVGIWRATTHAQSGPALAISHTRAGMTVESTLPVEAQAALVKQYCLGCHNDKQMIGGMSLQDFDPARAAEQAALSERVIRKLRAGMMPPPGARRPDAPAINAFAASLEGRIDQAAAVNPTPGRRTFQRLNRAEYARSVRDLLAIDVDVNAFLPPDTLSDGFDNIADAQSFSPTLLEGYLRAASRISYLAVGDPMATPTEATYQVPRTVSQVRRTEGAPFGTRGGISVVHNFPADGEYTFRMLFYAGLAGGLHTAGRAAEQIEVSVNGARVALLDIDPRMHESDPNGLNLQTPPIFVKAGPQRMSAAFIQTFEGLVDDVLAPIEHSLADQNIGNAPGGITTVTHLRELGINGPFRVAGVSDTPSRRQIFTCRPTAADEAANCAVKILGQLAARAYRRPVTSDEVKDLMAFYETGRNGADFETGIRTAVQAILASPHFLFRLEETPANVKPGQNYRLSALELASRLSYFLWASLPDEELITAARNGRLRTPTGLEAEVRRMLADPRANALATRFAAQWLRLQDLEKIQPDALLYPQWDHSLTQAMRRETELLVENLLRDDRSVLELLTADYTFVNERLARHYRIPNVTGTRFQRVALTSGDRRGLLGHGSILMMTSMASRTSPVNRGKWVMEVLLGSPPPPPPPDVPELEVTGDVRGTKTLSVRERMEEHRRNPACASCHRVIDPLGLALENFDATGAWRTKENGAAVDTSGTLYDGRKLDGPGALRGALLTYSESFVRTFTEALMAYAIGRRIEHFDMPAIRAITREAVANDYRVSAFVLGVVKSATFQMSSAEVSSTANADSLVAPAHSRR
jgi:hypothetical protein